MLSIYNSSINLCITKMLENTLGKHATKYVLFKNVERIQSGLGPYANDVDGEWEAGGGQHFYLNICKRVNVSDTTF